MYSYDQQDSYWGEDDYQWPNEMVEQEYNIYNERYQPVYSLPINESPNIEMMLVSLLNSQERMMQEMDNQELMLDRIALQQERIADQLTQQTNQSWDMEYEDGVDGTYVDELLEYSLGQPGQAEEELCEDNASLSEGCIPETPEYPPTIDEFEESVDSEIVLEFSTLVNDPKCAEFVDPFLQSIEEEPRSDMDVLVKKEQEEWAPLNIIEDFKKVSILLEVNVEDPFLVMPPSNKFECFHSFMVKLDSKSTRCSLILQPIRHLERMGTHLKVHCRLDGRKFKWDLKVD